MISLIIAAVAAVVLAVTDPKKEDRTNTGIKAFVVVFLVGFIALTYFGGDGLSGGAHDIEIGEPNF
jgi:ABC-type arginine/histidine transport system permease subunit